MIADYFVTPIRSDSYEQPQGILQDRRRRHRRRVRHGTRPLRRRRPRAARSASPASASASSTCTRTLRHAARRVGQGHTVREAGRRQSAASSERLPAMDKQGVDIQALSINGFWWYEAKDRGSPAPSATAQNEGLAEWVKQHPDRFVAMASVPLQFPDLAAEILQDAVTRLGARGVTLGGHVNGEDLSLPKFDPFWAKAAEMGELVFMHPGGAENIIRDGRVARPRRARQHHGQPARDDLLPVAPDLRRRLRSPSAAASVCGAHAGGYLPSYFGRTEVACDVRDNANCANKKRAEGIPAIADHRRHDDLLGRRPAAPRGRDGRQPDRLRHGQPVQLAGDRRPRAQRDVPEQHREGSDPRAAT